MSGKKRKHSGDDAGQPSKKVHQDQDFIAQDSAAKRVRFTVKDVGEWAPAIVTTPGLDLPRNVPLKAYRKARKPAGNAPRLGRSALATTELLLHTDIHPKLDYTAREESSGGVDGFLKHYVGVFDPRTGELQLFEARKLVVRGTLRSAALPNDPPEVEEPKTRLAARTILGEAFGTKKSQKAIRSLTENAISSSKPTQTGSGKQVLDAAASAVIESMSQNAASAPTREELQALVDEAKPRPKANLAAESVADVYTIEDLVGFEVLKALQVRDWQTQLKKGESITTASRYVSNRVTQVVISGDVKRLKALKYLCILVDWLGCLKKGSHKTLKLPPKEDVKNSVSAAGQPFLESIRKRFAPEITMNSWAIDNFMTHVCALALVVDLHEVDVYDLLQDLKIELKQIVQYFLEIGCRVKPMSDAQREKAKLTKAESMGHKIAKLRIPLEFPKNRTVPMKRR